MSDFDKPLPYTLLRSRRRTIALQITPDGQLLVRCPFRVSKAAVDRFVAAHRDWILRHRQRLEALPPKPVFTYSAGQQLFYLGEPLSIVLRDDITGASVQGDMFLLPAHTDDPTALTADFFQREAQRLLPDMSAPWAEKMGLYPTKISITAAKTRWGSCSAKNTINFSYRLLCLPPELITYVVVHELAHLQHHNHSAAFHALVAQYLPDHKELRAQLRTWARVLPF